jgi:hypothetical protein
VKGTFTLLMLLLSFGAFAQQAVYHPVALAPIRFGSTNWAQDPLQSPQSSEILTSPEIQQQILDEFKSEPALTDSALNVTVDDNSVLLSGEVHSEKEHELVLRIVHSYAATREIVDRITVNQPMWFDRRSSPRLAFRSEEREPAILVANRLE